MALKKSIDFSKPFISGIFAEGLSVTEPWGTWSDGDQVKFTFVRPLPSVFTMNFNAVGYSLNVGKNFTATVGDETQTFTLAGTPQSVSLDFINDSKADSVVLTIPEAKSPLELGLGGDTRKLGMGLIN